MEALDILIQSTFWVAAIRIASPLVLGTLGVLLCERAGVLNLGIEGIMVAGAFAGWFTVYSGGDLWAGVFVAAMTGAAFGLLHSLLTVPFGLACAVYAVFLTGGSLNVYSQIGLILVVGIMAKNGILIVEFANQLRDRGLAVRDAIEEAANIRLRPVLMTMIATVLGGVPLVISTGAGAEARQALGWIIVGGLSVAAVSTLLLTPVAYLLLARFSKPKAHEEARLESELVRAAALTAPVE